MQSIGFDVPVLTAASPAGEVTTILARLQEELDTRGATSRKLLAVAFEPQREQIVVTLRAHPLDAGYPDLSAVFGEIGRTCAEARIAAHQLRLIAFSERVVSLQLVNDWGQPEVYLYPVHDVSLAT